MGRGWGSSCSQPGPPLQVPSLLSEQSPPALPPAPSSLTPPLAPPHLPLCLHLGPAPLFSSLRSVAQESFRFPVRPIHPAAWPAPWVSLTSLPSAPPFFLEQWLRPPPPQVHTGPLSPSATPVCTFPPGHSLAQPGHTHIPTLAMNIPPAQTQAPATSQPSCPEKQGYLGHEPTSSLEEAPRIIGKFSKPLGQGIQEVQVLAALRVSALEAPGPLGLARSWPGRLSHPPPPSLLTPFGSSLASLAP